MYPIAPLARPTVHNTFWGFGAEEYPYSDIIDIQHHLSNTTPIGVVTDFPHNEIHFKDGYIYTMDECFMDVVNEDTELELITYVSEQSGIPISTIAQRELAP